MQLIYPALIRRTEKGFEGYFPDLEGCTFSGADLEDALEDARYAMSVWIDVELSEGVTALPPVSDAEDLKIGEDWFARTIAYTLRMFDGYDE